jgi:hypothetical protein
MSAVVGVLTESLTESIKGFYKLRKAYMTLDGILEAETRYISTSNGTHHGTPTKKSIDSLRSRGSSSSVKVLPGSFEDEGRSKLSEQETGQLISELKANDIAVQDRAYETKRDGPTDDDDDEFHDAQEEMNNVPQPVTRTRRTDTSDTSVKLAQLTIDGPLTLDNDSGPSLRTLSMREGMITHDDDSNIFTNPIDVFIHSGANLCFGLLLVMISMIPPAFGKLLFIIGFRGDRDRGLRMLWQASKVHNINGAMAGLILLGYYNTIVSFSDIIPEQDPSPREDAVEGYPKKRCQALLADMRIRHPRSRLWLLEEARMLAANRNLAAAMHLLQNSSKSPLKQVEALDMFEKSLDAMYMHNHTLCATSFIACISLNNWSHALYYYIAGAAHVELYRHYKTTSPRAAAIHAQKAQDFLRTAPTHAGKKKFMARQLPFDTFVTRKLNKWEQRAQEWKVPLIDAVGVSPIEEMIFLWNGYKRMDDAQLEPSMAALSWSENPTLNATWSYESQDERAILSLLRGAVLRNLGRWDEATAALENGVLSMDKAELKGGFKDDWTAPAAHYEMGVICWMRKNEQLNGSEKGEAYWVHQCEGWIEKAARWESYELDARIGLRIATAQDTLKKWKEKQEGGG